MYQVRLIITQMLDKDSWFEIGPFWGKTIVVGLGRLHGKSLVFISAFPVSPAGEDPEVLS